MKMIKKNIYNIAFWLITVLLVLSFIFLMLQAVLRINASAMEKGSETVTVLIDPGHGGEDGGAVSSDGVVEKGINLAIANYLKELYTLSGCNVVMTRDDDTPMGDQNLPTLKERKRADMNARLDLYNSDDIDFVISIHQNKFTDSKYSGAQVFFAENNEKSEVLAECLRKAIVGFLQPDNERELKKVSKEIYLLNNCNNPAVLVECGFLSNAEETAKLITPEYQKQMAFSIYCGTLEYIKSVPHS